MKVEMYEQGADALHIISHVVKSPEELIASVKKQLLLAQSIWPTELHGTKVVSDLPHVISLNVQSELAVAHDKLKSENQRLQTLLRRCMPGAQMVDLGDGKPIALYQTPPGETQ